MKGWERTKFVNLCENHVDCVNRTAPITTEPTPFKMIRTTNVKEGSIDVDNVRYVTEETYKKWTRRLVPRIGDIVLTREAPLGSVGMVRTADKIFLGQRLYHFRTNTKIADPNFMFYALCGPDLQGQIRGFGSGSTVEHMRLPDIEKLEFFAPDLGVQRRIGKVLSAYDDLIQNCERRIKVLDELVRVQYQEWFVNFRFPGHKKIGAAGGIPKGWRVMTAAEALEINPRVRLEGASDFPFLPMGSLSNSMMTIDNVERRKKGGGSKFQNGDTLFARITPCLENGKTGFVQFLPDSQSPAFGSTEFIVLRGRHVPPEFVYCLARSESFRGHAIKSMTGATGRQRVREACFNQYQMVVPPMDLGLEFSKVTQPMFRLTHELHQQAINLCQTRDLLLPRLISGQLDVGAGA